MTKVANKPADIILAFRTLGFPEGTPAQVSEPDQDSYMEFTWYLISHHRVGMVMYSIPPEESITKLPWESWYLDAGKPVHHIHYATRQHSTDFEWIRRKLQMSVRWR